MRSDTIVNQSTVHDALIMAHFSLIDSGRHHVRLNAWVLWRIKMQPIMKR